jgi:hypothetical protein
MPPPQLHRERQESLEFAIGLCRRPHVLDDVSQVVLEALVVIKFKAKTCGFAMARDRSKRGVDVISRKSNSHFANRNRQCREGDAH